MLWTYPQKVQKPSRIRSHPVLHVGPPSMTNMKFVSFFC